MSLAKETIYWVKIEESERTGHVLKEAWKNAQGELHREDRDQPAFRRYDEDTGVETLTIWWRNGKLHRDGDKPAFISYDPTSGRMKHESWHTDGPKRRENEHLPVSIEYDSATGDICELEFVDEQGDVKRTRAVRKIQAYVKTL